ncbi:hypothetical protein [Streptacidiphilus sp. MAP12-20]|uniref:hypothetical protein n=1 Tax=Streptacidiphilus sp. MAP12-20 TaxID=3156299 RepID=UPI0035175F0F
MTTEYNGSQVLFRQAKARSLAAGRMAQQADEEMAAGRSGMERRQRERDAAMNVVIMTQAAAEAYVNWVFMQAKVAPGNGTWISRWRGIPRAAEALGRDRKCGLPSEHSDFFNELDAWRNFLVHGDSRAMEALKSALENQGRQSPGHPVELLDSSYAASIVERAEAAFGWAQGATGITAPSGAGAWVAFDE